MTLTEEGDTRIEEIIGRLYETSYKSQVFTLHVARHKLQVTSYKLHVTGDHRPPLRVPRAAAIGATRAVDL